MFVQCRIIFGVNLVVARFASDQPLLSNADFKTGDIVDNVGGTNGVYTGTAENGSTDGTVEVDYKLSVINAIINKTSELIQKGQDYATPSSGTINFPLKPDQQLYLLSIKTFIDYGANLSLVDDEISVSASSGAKYTFQNNADYQGYFEALFARSRELENEQSDLIDQVTSAANSSAAMAPIITSNDART